MPLVYIPTPQASSPYHTYSPYQNHHYQPYQSSSYHPYSSRQVEFEYAARLRRQRERQMAEELRRKKEIQLQEERERLIHQIMQQRELEQYREFQHRQRQLQRQHALEYRPRSCLSRPISPNTLPLERFLSSLSCVSQPADSDDDDSENESSDANQDYEEHEPDESDSEDDENESKDDQEQPPSSSLRQLLALETKVHQLLSPSHRSLTALELDGHLTNLLLEADKIDPHGESDEAEVRGRRKELARVVEQTLSGCSEESEEKEMSEDEEIDLSLGESVLDSLERMSSSSGSDSEGSSGFTRRGRKAYVEDVPEDFMF